MKGKFIVIDGTDGSGKGTQTQLLHKRLLAEGYNVALFDFPQYGQPSSRLVELYLNGVFGDINEVPAKAASAFYAFDRYMASSDIKQALDEGKIILSNRYVSANMGHQGAKIQHDEHREEFLEWLHKLEYEHFGIPQPDMHIFLYMPYDFAKELVLKKEQREYLGTKKRDIHEKDEQHLRQAEKTYQYVAKKYKWQTVTCAQNDTLKSIQDIHEETYNHVIRLIRPEKKLDTFFS